MLDAGRSSVTPLVTGRLFAEDAREGARCGGFGVAHLAEAASAAARHLVPPPPSLAVAGTRERGSAGKGPPPEALVLLTSLLLFPRARAGAVPIHATHAEKASPKVDSQWRSGTLVCDESSLHWDEVETSEGDETVAAAAVGLLFCSSDSRRRNNCRPRCPPARGEPGRVGRGCREVRFPKPFLFNSRVLSKMSKYSTSTRTRIKVSCTRLYLSSLIFWMMMVLLI